MLTVLLGGARSGKSALAVEIASRGQNGFTDGVTYLATSPTIPGDDDLAQRIARHRAERPSTWTTVEEQIDIAAALVRVDTPVVIVDCLTLWAGNMLHHGHDEAAILDASDAAIAAVTDRDLVSVVISNEVGLGIVPVNELARGYRDVLGRVNQRWVAAADHALFMVAGRALPLHEPHGLLR
jgi:adenosyl cobinamide kinase/adenosyl cobinamide phosphate guanylyltransferase